MRTTLRIDDDVLAVARARSRREGRSVGEVLSDLARQALTAPRPQASLTERNGFPVIRGAGTTVTNDLVDQLRDEEGV